MAKVICVLYDDPVDGYPKSYPRDDLPKIDHYPEKLHSTQVLGPSVDQRWFRSADEMGSVSGWIKTNLLNPGIHDPRVLSGA